MEWVSGNIFIRSTKLVKNGDKTEGHTHNFDHTMIVFKGNLRISATLANGVEMVREATAPAHFLIRATVKHEMVALEDHTEYWCVYSHRNPQGDVIQNYDGWYEPMCELIISVLDQSHADPLIDTKLFKKGLVIDVFEDGHQYGRMELIHPMFRILKLPGVSEAFGRSLMGPEIGNHDTEPYLLHRQFRLNVDHPTIPEEFRKYLYDDSRSSPHYIADETIVASMKERRESVNYAIGDHPNIIG